MRWLWAAYQMGMWRDLMDHDLPKTAFAERAKEVISYAAYDWVLEARGDDGMHPVAIILAQPVLHGEDIGRGIEPFVDWFPWATVRNKLEATAAFLKEVAPRHKIYVFAEEPAIEFWTKFVHYGMIRRGCKVVDYFARGEHAMMFYTAGT